MQPFLKTFYDTPHAGKLCVFARNNNLSQSRKDAKGKIDRAEYNSEIVDLHVTLFRFRHLSYRALTHLHPTTSGGLAKRRLTLNVLRATSVQLRTALSAGLLPPLRQTAR